MEIPNSNSDTTAKSNKFTPKQKTVLLVDDDPVVNETIEQHLIRNGYKVLPAFDAESARKIFDESQVEIALLDINLDKVSGIDLLKEFKSEKPQMIVIMISAVTEVETVVKTIHIGAYDYLVKPIIDLNQVTLRIERALSERELKTENEALKRELSRHTEIPEIPSRAPSMVQVKEMIKTVAQYDSFVLITGESGTGKEVAARSIHKYSKRESKQFVAVNCGGIPATLLESTLFGYEKGAFTGATKQTRGLFEESDKGTIFLDEVTETTPEFQVKLLRVLEDRKIRRVGGTQEIELDIRVIAASNKDVKKLVEQGEFREDLYYRLNVVNITLPPLRDRTQDVPLIVDYQLKKLGERLGKEGLSVSPGTIEKFQNYAWPGNIRELINVLESAIIMSRDPQITVEDLPPQLRDVVPEEEYADEVTIEYQEAKTQFERKYFKSLLRTAEGNITEAARISGVTRQHLYHKMKQLDIEH